MSMSRRGLIVATALAGAGAALSRALHGLAAPGPSAGEFMFDPDLRFRLGSEYPDGWSGWRQIILPSGNRAWVDPIAWREVVWPATVAGAIQTAVPSPAPTAPVTEFGVQFLGTEDPDMYRRAADMGARWARIRFFSTQQNLMLPWGDEMIGRAKDAGLNVLLTCWYWKSGSPGGDVSDVDAITWREWAADIVTRWGHTVDAWQFENEPDMAPARFAGSVWGNVSQATTLVPASAKLVLPGLATDGAAKPGYIDSAVWHAQVFRGKVDVLALHAYQVFRSSNVRHKVDLGRRALERSLLDGVTSVWITEGGAGGHEFGLDGQARQVETWMTDAIAAEVSVAVLYRMQDESRSPTSFGLFDSSGSARPAAGVFERVAGHGV